MANIPFFVFLRLNYGLKDRVIAECYNVSAAENSSRGRNEPRSALPGWGGLQKIENILLIDPSRGKKRRGRITFLDRPQMQ